MGKYRRKSALYGVISARTERNRKRTQGDRQPQVIRDAWRQRFPRQIKSQGDQQPEIHDDHANAPRT